MVHIIMYESPWMLWLTEFFYLVKSEKFDFGGLFTVHTCFCLNVEAGQHWMSEFKAFIKFTHETSCWQFVERIQKEPPL